MGNESGLQEGNQNYGQILKSLIERQGIQEIMSGPIDKDEIDELFKNESSMCIIKYETNFNGIINKGHGTGFFIKFNSNDIPFKKALFTNNHILNKESIQVGKKIVLEN